MLKEKILIVDDEEDILELVKFNLIREGYSVIEALSGEQALQIIMSDPVDLIILDLMLPSIDGLEVTKRLKQTPQNKAIPIIMLTAKGEDSDIVKGLELGADDYITKPFSPKVIIARVKAVLRRTKTKEIIANDIIKIHNLAINKGKKIVSSGDKQIDLTYSEFHILVHLASHPGWVFTRSQIVDIVHGEDYPVTNRSVDVQIVSLRKKLGDLGYYIETVRGIGYRFKERT
ncbi:MAG: response regulator transcription factor [Desulfobacterales bacterium]|nr:response regulator transcription factor [Desulfobacterales bacterium]MBF0396406.1 response regulator transcription factor [Desulfobacterales bacterium]